jgi:aminoglycoside phosphotransferase family enzyme
MEAYIEAARDRPADDLVRFYTSFRAGLRAKIAVWHLRDAGVGRPEHWIARAGSYLEVGITELPAS